MGSLPCSAKRQVVDRSQTLRSAARTRAAFHKLADLVNSVPVHSPWPHAPPHYFTPQGVYLITGGTLHKAPLFNSPVKLDLFRDTTFELLAAYSIDLRAWAFFRNHYHVIIGFEDALVSHSAFIRRLHRELAVRLNAIDATRSRRVMYQFWDTGLTFEKSYLARLNYVHQNPVHHGLVPVANQYSWCSAAWFEREATQSFVNTVYSFKTDRLRVPDDF
jgi:putative transposase